MDENNQKLGVGLVVVASAVIGTVLVLFFGKMPAFLQSRYQITYNFPSAPRVTRDTPVRKNGVQIGRVADVRLLKDNQGVNLILELDRGQPIAQGETCRIAMGSLVTGDAFIEFIQPNESVFLSRFDGVAGGEKNGVIDPQEASFAQSVIADGDYLTGGVVSGDPLDMVVNMQGNIVNAFTAIEQASRRVESVAMTLESALGGGDGQLRDVADRVRLTIDNFNQTVQTVDRVARQFEQANLPASIGDTVNRLPFLFNEAERVLAQTQNTLRGFEDFSQSLQGIGNEFEGIGDDARETINNANRAMSNIADFTEPFSQQSEKLVGSTLNTLENLDATLSDLRIFAQKLNRSDGTLNRLVEDDQLYYELITTLENVRRISDRLQPVVDDVRVFTDKAARDPSQFGVKGLLRSGSVGAGLK